MVVSFDTTPDLRTELVEDTNIVIKAIKELRPGGGTALFDAIYLACQDRLQRDQPSTKFRRALIILGDGEDNNSRYTRDQALEMAQKADAVIYAISTNLSKVETDGDKVLKYLTAETGGRPFFPFKVEDLEVSFENLASELRHQYSLAYRPEPLVTDGLFHPIDLRVKNRKDLVVHARRGYYAPKK
jgi:Ca-activated chloride channel family protein